MASDEIWHLVEARRADGHPTLFRIRDLAPRPEQPTIFVVELPYPTTALSRLPDAAAYRRLSQFEEQWLRPACTALGWSFVATKTENGSSFFYVYGAGAPNAMVEKLAPFDGGLAFFDENDPPWDEYAALRELLAEANTLKKPAPKPALAKPKPKPKPKASRRAKPTTKKR